MTGTPSRTARGELSLRLTRLPSLLSPTLHNFPARGDDGAAFHNQRHVELLASQRTMQILRCRSFIIQRIRSFLSDRQFTEVATPLLASEAGGAIARPFRTAATEFPERSLSLRIAPELWLKRLILGGFDKIYEIGPSFRNEGTLDLLKYHWSDYNIGSYGLIAR